MVSTTGSPGTTAEAPASDRIDHGAHDLGGDEAARRVVDQHHLERPRGPTLERVAHRLRPGRPTGHHDRGDIAGDRVRHIADLSLEALGCGHHDQSHPGLGQQRADRVGEDRLPAQVDQGLGDPGAQSLARPAAGTMTATRRTSPTSSSPARSPAPLGDGVGNGPPARGS